MSHQLLAPLAYCPNATATALDVPKSLLAVIETDWNKLNGELTEAWLLVNENGTVTMN